MLLINLFNHLTHIFSYKQVCLAYKSCTGEDLDSKWLKQRRKTQDEFVYEEFCAIVTEHRQLVSYLLILHFNIY